MTEEPLEHAPRPHTADHYCRKRKPRCQSGPLFVVYFVKLHITALENSITLCPYNKELFDVPSSVLLSSSLGNPVVIKKQDAVYCTILWFPGPLEENSISFCLIWLTFNCSLRLWKNSYDWLNNVWDFNDYYVTWILPLFQRLLLRIRLFMLRLSEINSTWWTQQRCASRLAILLLWERTFSLFLKYKWCSFHTVDYCSMSRCRYRCAYLIDVAFVAF